MLDSLVRVSRRVGWRTDRFATDPKRPMLPGRSRHAVGENCKQCFPSRTHPGNRGQSDAANPRSRNESTRSGYNTPSRRRESPSRSAYDRPETGRGALPEESALDDDGRTPGGSLRIPDPTSAAQNAKLNSPGRLCGSTRLPLSGFTYS